MEDKKLKIVSSARIRFNSWMQFFLTVAVVIVLYTIATYIHLRLDLTEDQRYTLSAPTHKVLSELKNDIYIQVYLEGEMEIAFKRLRRSVREMLDEFRIASGKKVDFEFINPSAGKDQKTRNNQYQALVDKGLNQINIRSKDSEGGTSQKLIFPGMIVNYNGVEVAVNFLSNNTSLSPEQNLLHSAEGLEYQIIQTISTLCSDSVRKVAFLEGHGEIPEIGVADLTLSLAKFFTVDRGVIGGRQGILKNYSALVIAGPETSFDERDKLAIDQYIMSGGKVLWLIEEVKVDIDSLNYGETVALSRSLNIEDQLFKYGVRVNPAIIQDLDCVPIPVTIETGASQKQVLPLRWIYYPLLNPSPGSTITRNLNKVMGRFVNPIDTVGMDPDIRKKVLLTTSTMSRTVKPPMMISLKELDSPPASDQFSRSFLPVAILLEGRFKSAFRNRMINGLVDDKNFRLTEESKPTRMIIVGDADIIRNDVDHSGGQTIPLPLGLDRYTQGTFGNKDFLINSLNYLVDDNGIMELRSRELKLRLLDRQFISRNRLMIQLINTALPVILVILAGFIYGFLRRKKYANN